MDTVEASLNPDRAVPYAVDASSMSGVAHLQHLPGHIYPQVGQWKKAVDINIDAAHILQR